MTHKGELMLMKPAAITLTLGACVAAESALTRLAAQAWPIRTAYKMAKLLRLLRVETAALEDQRIALIRQLGRQRPPSDDERARGVAADVFEVPADLVAEYGRQLRDLQALTIPIAWTPLTLDDFGTSAVSANDVLDLGPLIADGPVIVDGI